VSWRKYACSISPSNIRLLNLFFFLVRQSVCLCIRLCGRQSTTAHPTDGNSLTQAQGYLSRVIYYTGHETIIPVGSAARLGALARRAVRVYASHAQRPGAYFRIPSAQIMEIGIEFEI